MQRLRSTELAKRWLWCTTADCLENVESGRGEEEKRNVNDDTRTPNENTAGAKALRVLVWLPRPATAPQLVLVCERARVPFPLLHAVLLGTTADTYRISITSECSQYILKCVRCRRRRRQEAVFFLLLHSAFYSFAEEWDARFMRLSNTWLIPRRCRKRITIQRRWRKVE